MVREESMFPAYEPGEHVLTWNWGQARKGEVVVFRQGNKYFIKRIDKFVDNYVYVSGDNKRKSTKMKPVKKAQIIGKVILKY